MLKKEQESMADALFSGGNEYHRWEQFSNPELLAFYLA